MPSGYRHMHMSLELSPDGRVMSGTAARPGAQPDQATDVTFSRID
jgi:hypothetical protein